MAVSHVMHHNSKGFVRSTRNLSGEILVNFHIFPSDLRKSAFPTLRHPWNATLHRALTRPLISCPDMSEMVYICALVQGDKHRVCNLCISEVFSKKPLRSLAERVWAGSVNVQGVGSWGRLHVLSLWAGRMPPGGECGRTVVDNVQAAVSFSSLMRVSLPLISQPCR